jgi:hypothetical protein
MCAASLAWTVSGTAAAAADFSLTIGNPVAASGPSSTTPVIKTKVAKNALFAVRFEDCAELDKAQISGIGEGIVDGARVSAPVVITPAGSPGVFVASPSWDQIQGAWVVSLSASCGKATKGALVPVGPQGFIREKIKLLPRQATKAEIDAALKTAESVK